MLFESIGTGYSGGHVRINGRSARDVKSEGSLKKAGSPKSRGCGSRESMSIVENCGSSAGSNGGGRSSSIDVG